MANRESIPIDLQRRLLVEAGHRCAIPTCRYNRVEFAHIVPYSQVKKHDFENLIVLCPNCHDLYDKDKKIDLKSMQAYKINLSLLNHRYGEFERRLLQYFLTYPDRRFIIISEGQELAIFSLIKDSFLVKTDINSGISTTINTITTFSWWQYELTEKGRGFIKNWKEGIALN